MVHIESSTGIEADVTLDFDKVCAYEREHPDWSIITELSGFGGNIRLTSLDLLTSFIYEGGWKAWVRDGFTIQDLTLAITEGLKELGFTLEEPQSAE